MLVKEIMSKDVITISPDTTLSEVSKIFKEKRISGVPVVDKEGEIVGIITLTNLLRILNQIYKWKELEKRVDGLKLSNAHEEEKSKAKVSDIMTKDVITVGEETTLDEVMGLMFTKGIHTMPVIRDGRLVGIVGKRDVICACF